MNTYDTPAKQKIVMFSGNRKSNANIETNYVYILFNHKEQYGEGFQM
jgi:hypothetical protein